MSQNDANFLPDAVQWAEGMLLTPQHFQQNDIYWNAVLQHRMCGVNVHHWGVLELQLDMPLLAGRTVDVKQLSCIFPDGTPFVLKPDNVRALRLILKPEELTDGKTLRVCIAMPPRTGTMNVQSTSIKRYESLLGTHPVIDEMTGFADVFIDRIRPTVKLYREQDIPAGYQSIALIEVSHNVQSAQVEPTSFHPPMLRMGAGSFLGGSTGLLRALHQLRDRMWDKMHKLTGMTQIDGPERMVEMNPAERMQLGLARHLASALPMFDAIMLDVDAAPVQAYRALAHVVGSMAWVGSNPAPLVMSAYAHENCAPQFFAAIEYVARKLSLINTDWESMAFSRMGELTFSRRLPEDVSSVLLIEVRLREGQSLRDVQEWLADSRIGSEELMPVLRQRRLPGALCQVLSSAQIGAMGLRSDSVVVRIENQQVEVPQQGMVDCFQAGRSLVIQSNNVQFMPSAVILQLRRTAGEGVGQDHAVPQAKAAEAIHA